MSVGCKKKWRSPSAKVRKGDAEPQWLAGVCYYDGVLDERRNIDYVEKVERSALFDRHPHRIYLTRTALLL